MFLQFILCIQFFFALFIIFFIKTFFSNEKNSIIFFFIYITVSFSIVGLFIYTVYYLNFYSPNIESHIFIHKEKVWGLTLVLKSTMHSYICLWYKPIFFKKAQALIFLFYSTNGFWPSFIFFYRLLLASSIFKCFVFFYYFCENKISFPLNFKDHSGFIFFVKYIFLFEFLITALYFVRVIYVPGST